MIKELRFFKRITFYCGIPGTFMTESAIKFCETNPGSLYFSFHYINADFAPAVFSGQYPEIFGSCKDWKSFFDRLSVYAEEKSPAIFFDCMGNVNETDMFYRELKNFLCENVRIILMGRPRDSIPFYDEKLNAETYTMPEIADKFSVKDEEAAKIFCLTSGLPALLAEYDFSKSFEDNVSDFLNTGSLYYRLADDMMKECFRITGTYNMLLYGMAKGHNRISELTEFSRCPKNKCDKYIKSMTEHGLVKKVKGKNGYGRYYPAITYLSLWYGVLFTALPGSDGSFDGKTKNEFINYFDKIILPEFYKSVCLYWIEKNIWEYSPDYINVNDISLQNVRIGNIDFIFAAEKDRGYYFFLDSVPGEKLTFEKWEEIKKATVQKRPFYENEYFLFSVNRVPDNFWKLNKTFDNVHIIQRKTMLTEFKKEYMKKFHPRSFNGFFF